MPPEPIAPELERFLELLCARVGWNTPTAVRVERGDGGLALLTAGDWTRPLAPDLALALHAFVVANEERVLRWRGNRLVVTGYDGPSWSYGFVIVAIACGLLGRAQRA